MSMNFKISRNLKISRKRRDTRINFKYTCKVNEFNPFVEKLEFDKMPNIINFWVNKRSKSMLSIAPFKKCCIVKSMGSII